MDCLLLRLDAQLMSFGGVLDESANPTERFPGRSLLTGLLGNAMGWDHRDVAFLQSLQGRLRHAARWDAEPELVIDYHTVDFSQSMFQDTGWTTRGKREDRGGGSASDGTHQRYRHYWANGVCTVAIALAEGGEPSLDTLVRALRVPARPLFLGRKTCVPAEPLWLARREEPDLRTALQHEPLANIGPRRRPSRVAALWPAGDGGGSQIVRVDDLRDWHNNLHRGATEYAVGFLEVSK